MNINDYFSLFRPATAPVDLADQASFRFKVALFIVISAIICLIDPSPLLAQSTAVFDELTTKATDAQAGITTVVQVLFSIAVVIVGTLMAVKGRFSMGGLGAIGFGVLCAAYADEVVDFLFS